MRTVVVAGEGRCNGGDDREELPDVEGEPDPGGQPAEARPVDAPMSNVPEGHEDGDDHEDDGQEDGDAGREL